MKIYNSLELLEQLQSDVRRLICSATILQKEDPAILLEQPAVGKWSVTQVLEHLNSYGRYYLPAIKKSLAKKEPAKTDFKPGWLGNYFTRLMQPREDGKINNKMSAPKNHLPLNNLDAKPVLENFIQQQQELIELLELAKKKNIGLIRTPISISRFIRLKLGDVFRFLVMHEQRHFIQVQNTMLTMKEVRDIYRVSRLAVLP